ncbi:hypothetical protein A2856_03605 [Candidatus Uhrbacteria bacterium RIFCSPHIGHO2_01_FULL_63_20]|uniref:PKD domain-containing protein n=1 Tax=Candidatus Uhrbacteria bacterium RIFCSPHIGHO2_01_FULL_63_20 TaxID=1802385 RepID=A0A1F7TNN7_9BACT|nr:MAG: hypothetical protein A2856_03605 [Candidatus Uhrbacteria bacterium RIFCSPHIGHO2_01_FULL_63_20]
MKNSNTIATVIMSMAFVLSANAEEAKKDETKKGDIAPAASGPAPAEANPKFLIEQIKNQTQCTKVCKDGTKVRPDEKCPEELVFSTAPVTAPALETVTGMCPDGATSFTYVKGDKKSHDTARWKSCPKRRCEEDGKLHLVGINCSQFAPKDVNLPPVAKATFETDGLVVSFDGTGSDDDNGIVDYAWTFHDGTKAKGPTATKTYKKAGTYWATLEVKDGKGKKGKDTVQVTVSDAPKPPPPPPDPEWIEDTVKCVDMATSTARQIVIKRRSKPKAGEMPIQCVNGDLVDHGSDCCQTKVEPPPPPPPPPPDNMAPVARITVKSANGRNVLLNGQESTDDHGITAWFWEFCDGSTSDKSYVEKTLEPGECLVKLTVTDVEGLSGTDVKKFTTEPPEGDPLDFKDLYVSFGSSIGTKGCVFCTLAFGTESDPDQRMVRGIATGFLDLGLRGGVMNKDWIVVGELFGTPLTVLDFAHDDDLRLQPYTSFIGGGGLDIENRIADNLAVGGKIVGTFHATNIDQQLVSFVSSAGVMVGPTATWTIMRLGDSGFRLNAVGSLLVGVDVPYMEDRNARGTYKYWGFWGMVPQLMPSIGIELGYGGAVKTEKKNVE